MTRLNRLVPYLIVAVAVLHFVWAFMPPNTFADIAGEGFFATVSDTTAAHYDARDADMWFLVCGIGNLAIGTLTQAVVRETGRVPTQTGVYLLVLGVVVSIIFFPVNPGPLFIAIGVLALVAANQRTSDVVLRGDHGESR
jgi:hypothetical protein